MSRRSTLAVAVLVLLYSAGNPRQQQESLPSTPPMIVLNPDGTLTVQKEPKGKPGRGLRIPRQIVIPIIPAPYKKPAGVS